MRCQPGGMSQQASALVFRHHEWLLNRPVPFLFLIATVGWQIVRRDIDQIGNTSRLVRKRIPGMSRCKLSTLASGTLNFDSGMLFSKQRWCGMELSMESGEPQI